MVLVGFDGSFFFYIYIKSCKELFFHSIETFVKTFEKIF